MLLLDPGLLRQIYPVVLLDIRILLNIILSLRKSGIILLFNVFILKKQNMNMSYSKIRHIQESNQKLENRLLGRKVLFEYDIDDDNKVTIDQELSTIATDIQELNPDLDFSSVKSAQDSLSNSDVCMIGDDVSGYVTKKFGEKIKQMFPDKVQDIIKVVSENINKFIDYISTLKLSDLKSLLKTLKNKIKGDKEVSEEILKEFFGTSMAIVTIGTFSMPALVLTIASWVLVVLVGLWLLNQILCSFNISMSSVKRCRVRSFSWGQCK